MVVIKHYDNGVMLKLEDDGKMIFVWPDGTTIRPTDEEADEMWDNILHRILVEYEGTKQ